MYNVDPVRLDPSSGRCVLLAAAEGSSCADIYFRLSGKDSLCFGFLLVLGTRHRLLLRSVCCCRDGGRRRKNETGFLSGRLGGASLPLLQSPSSSSLPSSYIKQPPPLRSALVTSTEDRHCPALLVTWSPTTRPSRCKQNVC